MSPTPDGSPLTIKVRCWTSKAPRAPFAKHAATLHADWSVDVPHDLEAERLAQAFGGWLSCLELETSTIPAARVWLDLTLRNVPPPLHLTPAGRWVARYQQGCCPTTGFAAVGDAFEHLRSLNHLALQKKVDRKQLNDLVKVLGAAHGVDKVATIPDDVAELAAQGLTCGRADVGRLWHAGVHPPYVLDIRENLGLTMRLPMSFYLAVLLRKVASTLSPTVRSDGYIRVGLPSETEDFMGEPSGCASLAQRPAVVGAPMTDVHMEERAVPTWAGLAGSSSNADESEERVRR